MKKIRLERVYLPGVTLGSLYDEDRTLLCKTLELPWKENKRGISCIPEGTYDIFKEPPKPTRNYPYFRFRSVPGRSNVLIHTGNYTKDILGCILVGSGFTDLNKDGILDVVESTKTLAKLIEMLPQELQIEIVKKNA